MSKENVAPQKRPFKKWQIRWNEAMGKVECPYAFRWVLNTPFGSLRVHRWINSDDTRAFHDHPYSFLTLVVKGSYTDVSEAGRDIVSRGQWRFRAAEHKHYVEVPESGAWSILLCENPRRKWGYWVEGKFRSPMKYFHKHGHPVCDIKPEN